MSVVLQQIASLASSLSHAELRVLLDIAVRAETSGASQASGSSRDLARSTGLARASVQSAIDSLNHKGLIYSHDGSPTQPTVHHLLCFCAETQAFDVPTETWVAQQVGQGSPTRGPVVAQKAGQAGPTTSPVPAQEIGQGGLKAEPGVAQKVSHGGPTSEPPTHGEPITCEPSYIKRASVSADSTDFDFDKTIDRLQKAKKADFDGLLFEVGRQRIASHHAKYARPENQLPGLPDDAITAQFLAIAEWRRLEGLLLDLASERKEAGHSYGWYVTVALQRIHGIPPDRLREIRTRLKKSATSMTPVSRRDTSLRKPIGREQPKGFYGGADVEELKQQIRTAAVARSMR